MRRSSNLSGVFLVAVVASSAVVASRMTAQPSSGTSVMRQDTTAVYSDSQATAGQAVWAKSCAECHETKDVTGPDFRTKWGGQPLFTVFEQIRTTMPDGNPGSLPKEDYAAALAYILKLNGLPAGGTPLATDSVALSAIKLNLPPAPPAP